jgi:hypothetical protein
MIDEPLARNVEIAHEHVGDLRRMKADIAQTVKSTYDALNESWELMDRADNLLAKHDSPQK